MHGASDQMVAEARSAGCPAHGNNDAHMVDSRRLLVHPFGRARMVGTSVGGQPLGLHRGGVISQPLHVRRRRHLHRHGDDFGLGELVPYRSDGVPGQRDHHLQLQLPTPDRAQGRPGPMSQRATSLPTPCRWVTTRSVWTSTATGPIRRTPPNLPTQTVDQADTTTTITSPSPGSSIGYGSESQMSFDVTVSGPQTANQVPSNQVDLYAGDTYLCTAFIGGGGNGTSSGNCYMNDTTLDAGSYMITAVYGGDDNYIGSSSAPQDLTVEQVNTQMSVVPRAGLRAVRRGKRQLLHCRHRRQLPTTATPPARSPSPRTG